MAILLTGEDRTRSRPVNGDRPAKKAARRSWWLWGAAALGLLLALYGWFGATKPDTIGATFVARRGPLQISVLEGGSIEARESQEIRSEIKGYQGTKILSIVEEGYLVTEEDVRNGKVLVELDSSDIKQRIVTHDSQFQSTIASLIEAQQAYDIQLNQNKSDLKLAEQKVRFARMDLEKYLGDRVATEILAPLHLGEGKDPGSSREANKAAAGLSIQPMLTSTQVIAALTVNTGAAAIAPSPFPPRTNASNDFAGLAPITPNFIMQETEELDKLPLTNSVVVDFTKYAKAELLGDGAAQQNLRKLEDDLLVAQSELKMAETKMAGSERLRAKDFLTKTEYENDKLTVEKTTLKVKTAKTALDLFIKYEFRKAAEEFLSKYDETLQALERARKEAISKLAQARAKLRGVEGRYRIEEALQRELYDQLSKCVIRALKPGLVVYGGGGDRRFYGEEQIREGATVRERQPIITIPDMTQMAVRVKIHEAQIKKIQKGMKARIQIDAFPDKQLTGEVTKVAVLPDSQDRWMNPDMKVYLTTIDINGVQEWLKPGMSAKVEILVDQLDDVVFVPIQAVTPSGGKHLCYAANHGDPEAREVEIGQFNDEFIEIKKGLKEGERVLLRAPDAVENESEPNVGNSEKPTAPQPPAQRGERDQKPGAKPQKDSPKKPAAPAGKPPAQGGP